MLNMKLSGFGSLPSFSLNPSTLMSKLGFLSPEILYLIPLKCFLMGKQLKELVVIIIVVLLIRAFLAQAYNIPSGSMIPTLLVGDFILVNKLVYRISEPLRGDMVVFKYPLDERIDFIKRVIAKGGDRVEFVRLFDERTNTEVYKVVVNGKDFSISYVGDKEKAPEGCSLIYEEKIYRDNGEILKHEVCYKKFGFKTPGMLSNAIDENLCLKYEGGLCTEFIVPKGYYFVMGDNRDNSRDSRYWGFVPRENIIGKAFVIYYSGETPHLTPEDVGPFTVVRQIVSALLHPRFSRIGKPLIH